jgi:hypothetical protein
MRDRNRITLTTCGVSIEVWGFCLVSRETIKLKEAKLMKLYKGIYIVAMDAEDQEDANKTGEGIREGIGDVENVISVELVSPPITFEGN